MRRNAKCQEEHERADIDTSAQAQATGSRLAALTTNHLSYKGEEATRGCVWIWTSTWACASLRQIVICHTGLRSNTCSTIEVCRIGRLDKSKTNYCLVTTGVENGIHKPTPELSVRTGGGINRAELKGSQQFAFDLKE